MVGFAWAYDEVRALHGNVVAAGLRHGEQLLRLDRDLHVDWAPALNAWLTRHDAVEIGRAHV